MDVDENVLLEHLDFSEKGTDEAFLNKVHDFYTNSADEIAAFIRSKGLVSLPLVKDYRLFQPLLLLHLLTSNHAALRLPPGGEENGHYVKIRRWRSTYDDIGCDYESMLDFGDKAIVGDFLKHAQPLLKSGVLSLIPSNLIADWKGCGAPEPVDYKGLLKAPAEGSAAQDSGSFEPGALLVHEIVLPIVREARSADLLKLITDEWGSFQRCREHLTYASVEMGRITSAAERELRFIKAFISMLTHPSYIV